MEEVSPYSTDVVFLAQLVIITAYSPCVAVNTTIRNAAIWGVLSLSLPPPSLSPATPQHTFMYIFQKSMCT